MLRAVPKELLGFLKPYDRKVRELALAVRATVLEEMAPCHENIYDAYNAVAIGYGSSDRLKDGVCHVAVYSNYVNLGFNRGAEMEDPERILSGSGRLVRHITIRTPEDLARPAVRRYLRQAKQRVGRLSERDDVTSVVKSISPKKRRPS